MVISEMFMILADELYGHESDVVYAWDKGKSGYGRSVLEGIDEDQVTNCTCLIRFTQAWAAVGCQHDDAGNQSRRTWCI